MSVLLAAVDVADQTVTQWVVGAVATAIVTTLGLLVRHAVGALASSVEANTKALGETKAELLTKMDGLRDQVSRGDGDRRVLEVRVVALEAALLELKREVREVSEGIAR